MIDTAGVDNHSRRRFRLIFVYLLLLSPWIAKGAMSALETTANSPLDWVDSDFAPRADYDRFAEDFGAGDVVVISWPGCTIDHSRLDSFTQSLRSAPAFYDGDDWLFHRVTSGREVLRQMTSPPMSLSVPEATGRISPAILGPDGSTTAVVIGFNEQGLRQRGRLVPLIRAAALKYAGAEYANQHLAGPIIDGYEVDLASQTTMSRLAPLSSIIVFCVCLLCLDSLSAAILVFGISCICQGIALAVMHYCGGTMTALLIVLPPLIQVLAIAGGIHLINYYFDSAGGTPDEAIATAVRIGWLPCVLSSTTTAIGLGSLAVSGLAAVREFGVFAAIGVITTLGSLLVLMPGIIRWKPIKRPASRQHKPSSVWIALLSIQKQHAGLISVVGIGAMVALGLGVAKLQASVRIETLFGSDSRLIRDYAWIEENVGPLVPIEVIVEFNHLAETSASDRLATLDRVQNCLLADNDVQAMTSCRDFMPPSPFPLTGDFASQYLESVQGSVSKAGYLQDSGSIQRWRITAHMSALGDHDYGKILDDLRTSVESELAVNSDTSTVEIELSGLMPLVHEIQRQLLHDLYASFLTAFGLIAIVMTIVQAGFIRGLVSMVPNVFPSLALFGVLGWLDYPIDIGSIMTASVAMGIAVDDTLHFLNFFDRRIAAGESREHAILAAYQHCGRAMIQTTLICGAGLAIFAFSDFVPTARFAWMMVALLAAALIGDLVLLPALLLGPFSRTHHSEVEFSPPIEEPQERKKATRPRRAASLNCASNSFNHSSSSS